MKIAILGNANSIHIKRWAEGLHDKGLDIHLLSCHAITMEYSSGISLYQLTPKTPYGYILAVWKLKKLLNRINPDLLHAHYVSGYGTLAMLSGYRDLMLSAWGADVYDFPRKSKLHHWLIAKNLKQCLGIGSTSHCMREVIESIHPKLPPVYVTPFGVETNLFRSVKDRNHSNAQITIGTVKLLHDKYGIDTLIRAYSIVVKRLKNVDTHLVIVGSGPEEQNLKALAQSLNLSHQVTFKGYIENSLVPQVLNELDIFVALSRLDSESFGVAAVEANACELPVVVSDVSGFKEVVVHEKTGLVVERDNPEAAAKAICGLIEDEGLRLTMGRAGREHVLRNYSWDVSVDRMVEAYSELLNEE